MSNPPLPPEILDYIADFLHNNKQALRECCLVSKSWISRTRKHLFAHIAFSSPKILRSWKETFPDPSNSPAYHTHTLTCSRSVADATAGDWIAGFFHVVHLEVTGGGTLGIRTAATFVPFHGFSPAIKSLRVDFTTLPTRKIFNLILSFPLLEDLSVSTYFEALRDDDGGSGRLPTAVQPPNPPMFTGSLHLSMRRGMGPVASRLLSFSGGIRFRRLTLTPWSRNADGPLVVALVRECSDTLESLKITLPAVGTSIQHLLPFQ